MPFDSQNFEPSDPVLGVLRELRAFHSDPRNWRHDGRMGCIGASQCLVYAASVIAGGAVRAASIPWPPNAVLDALTRALPAGAKNLVVFNEQMGTTHAQLMELYDRAIEMRRAKVLAAA